MPVPYVGAYPSDPRDLVDVQYITDQIAALNLSEPTVQSLIGSGLAAFANKSYVDAQDALNATKAYVDTGDATKLHVSQIGANNGIVGLNANGVIDLSRLNLSANQRWPSPFNSPSSYFSSATAFTTEGTLYTASVADPGYIYKLLIFGVIDAKTSVDGEWPVLYVRVGATNGPIVAYGLGNAEHYSYSSLLSWTTAGTYSVVAQSTLMDVAVCGAGGGGSSASGSTFFGSITPQIGARGAPGSWNAATITPTLGQTLTITVGAGGPGGPSVAFGTETPGTAGGASSISGAGITTLTAAGGARGNGFATGSQPPNALGPGNEIFDGITYPGGAGGVWRSGPPGGALVSDGSGTAPGGAGTGGGGNNNGTQYWAYGGGNGGDGGVFLAQRTPPGSGDPDNAAQVTVMPLALDAQSALTGAQTLYIRMLRSGSTATVTANAFKPTLWICPIPA